MKILVLNCGSSSIKYKLYDMDSNTVVAAGGAEKVGKEDPFIKLKTPVEKTVGYASLSHAEGVAEILKFLTSPETGVLASLSEIDAVGHRVVQGGDKFSDSVLVDDSVEQGIKELIDLAPEHNAAHLAGIVTINDQLPGVPQVCVFDNAFFSQMPEHAYRYAVDKEVADKYHVRRYGFHGTSHRYVSQRVCDFLGRDIKTQRIITCHIGNGASVSAIKDGVCIDTSMGFTPLAGLVMGTRSGDIDPSAVLFLMEKMGKQPQEMATWLNKECGVLGVSGIGSDMRDIEKAGAEGDPAALVALDMYTYRIKKYIGAYAAAMGGVDIIVWTAGAGENQTGLRADACEGLGFLGVEIDLEANKVRGEEALISTKGSKVAVCVIPTDEEGLIARDTRDIVSKLK